MWFAASRSAISIPPYSEAIARFVDQEWSVLQIPLGSDQVVAGFVDKSGGRFTLEEIRREVARRHSDEEDEAPTDESLRRDEYRALVEGMPPRERDSEFVSLSREIPEELSGVIQSVRKVTRLREVRALYGFARRACKWST